MDQGRPKRPRRRLQLELLPTLASHTPSQIAVVRVQALEQQLDQGQIDETLAVLGEYAAYLGEHYPLLDRLVGRIVETTLLGRSNADLVQQYARNIFYVLRLESDLNSTGAILSTSDEARLREAFRANLPRAFNNAVEASEVASRMLDALNKEALEALWQEGARRTLERGREWFFDSWVRPEMVDYFLRQAYGHDERQVPKPDEDDLVWAFSGLARLISADEADSVRAQIAYRSVLPRLFVRRWPEAAELLVEEVETDNLIAQREHFAEIKAEIERLRAQRIAPREREAGDGWDES